MAKIYALYRTPTDPKSFDRYYSERHMPLAKTMPGLRSYEIPRGTITALGDPTPYYLIATLTFDSRAAIDAALASPQGQATAGDLANFATGGVDLLIAETAPA